MNKLITKNAWAVMYRKTHRILKILYTEEGRNNNKCYDGDYLTVVPIQITYDANLINPPLKQEDNKKKI